MKEGYEKECMITKIMQMDAEMAYDSLPKQETLSGFEEGHKANLDWLEQNSNQVKQETLEEAAERLQKDKYGIFISKDADVKGQLVIDTAKAAFLSGIKEGAKWQAKRCYSEEEVKEFLHKIVFDILHKKEWFGTEEWFEQFKK